VGWRWTFVAATVFPILALVALPPLGRRTRGPRPTVSQRVGIARSWRARRPPTRGARELRWLAVAGALAALSIGALNGFAVVSSVDAGISEAGAGMLVASGGALASVVRIASGWFIDRSADDGFRAVTLLSIAGAFGYAAMAIGTPLSMTVGVLLAFGAGWGWPGLFHYGLVRSFPDAPGYATGVIQTGFATGTSIGPMLFGLISDEFAYSWAWRASAAVTLLSALLIAFTAGRLRRVLASGPPGV
jgi:MFS family permease